MPCVHRHQHGGEDKPSTEGAVMNESPFAGCGYRADAEWLSHGRLWTDGGGGVVDECGLLFLLSMRHRDPTDPSPA